MKEQGIGMMTRAKVYWVEDVDAQDGIGFVVKSQRQGSKAVLTGYGIHSKMLDALLASRLSAEMDVPPWMVAVCTVLPEWATPSERLVVNMCWLIKSREAG